MPSSTSIRPLLYTSVAEASYNEIVSRTGRYYYFLGKVLEWPNELSPPEALDSIFYEKDTRRNIVLVKEILPGDVSLVVDRISWQSNVVYDMYDDRYSDEIIGIDLISGGGSYSSNTQVAISGGGGTGATANVVINSGVITSVIMTENGFGYNSLPTVTITDLDSSGSGANAIAVISKPYSGANSISEARFYVLTDEFNIYKCLDNNGNSPSTVKPADVTVEPFVTSDGYKWKFIGSVSPSLKNKFLTSTQMPVTSSLSRNFYGNGEIKKINILRTGENYTYASLTVDGDGYLESDPFLINSVTIKNSGSGYTTANAVIDSPVAYSQDWVSGNVVYSGTRIRAGNNIYQATLTGNMGIAPPIHTTDEEDNGSTRFKYLATVATANVTVSSGNVTGIQLIGSLKEVNIISGGSGYTQAPDVRLYGGNGTGGAGYAVVKDGAVIKVNLTDIGSNFTTPPSIEIGTPWTANARTSINSQVYGSTRLYTVSSANTNFRITDARYDYKTANVSNNITQIKGVSFNNTGTSMYVVGATPNTVSQFNLSTAYDVSTAAYAGNIIITQERSPQDVTFSRFGNVMFVSGLSGSRVYRYNLSNSWNVSTATYVSNVSVLAHEANVTGHYIDYTGTRLYVTGNVSDRVVAYTMATPWDIANASYSSNISISGIETNSTGIFFNNTGTIMSVVGTTGKAINQYYLSNAWNIQSATYFTNLPVDGIDTNPQGIYYAEDQNKLYLAGGTANTIFQYNLPKIVLLGSTVPTHTTGNVYNGDALLQYAGNAATATVSLKYGSGYLNSPNITIYGNGANAVASIDVVKSEAILSPIIDGGKIVNINIINGGIGYTTAKINVNGDGSNASFYVDLTEGDIQTLQGNNELLAVDGAIEAIKVVSGGYNYSSANVTIYGDGYGATANAVVNNGRVTKIIVDSAGADYTFANVVIQGNGSGASARAILPPEGGHGSDIVSELYARSLAMYSSISSDRNQGFDVVNDYRQIGLIKDIERFDNKGFFTKITGSGCFVLSGNTVSNLIVDDKILTSARNARYQVIAKTNQSVLVTSLDKIDPVIGDIMYANATVSFIVSGVTPPDVDKYSGKLMYIDNREAFVSSDEQFVSIKTVFKY